MIQYPFIKIRQTFPPSKFCAIRYIATHACDYDYSGCLGIVNVHEIFLY